MESDKMEVRRSFSEMLWEKFYNVKNSNNSVRVIESAAAIKNAPGAHYVVKTAKGLSNACRVTIYDAWAKAPAVRFDMPHQGMKAPHMNINHKLAGVRDPHLKIPGAAVKTAEMTGKTFQYIGNAAFATAVVADTYRCGKAYYDDYNESGSMYPGKNLTTTGASVAGAWLGGTAGAVGGNLTGALIGSVIGCPFGPAGSLAGAAIFSLAGMVVGGIAGGIGTSNLFENIAKNQVSGENHKNIKNY